MNASLAAARERYFNERLADLDETIASGSVVQHGLQKDVYAQGGGGGAMVCAAQVCGMCGSQVCGMCASQVCGMCGSQVCGMCASQVCGMCGSQVCGMCGGQACSMCGGAQLGGAQTIRVILVHEQPEPEAVYPEPEPKSGKK